MDPRRQFSNDNLRKLAEEWAVRETLKKPRPWETLTPGAGGARPKQLPPDHPGHHLPWTSPRTGKIYQCSDDNPHCTGISEDWTTWVILAGRGFGKTITGAQWCLKMALSEPGLEVGVGAPSYSGVQDICFEGSTGVLKVALPGEVAEYNRNRLRITLRNGSIILGFTAEKEESVRGMNLSYCWFDEFAYMPYQRFYDYALLPALRVAPGNNPPRLLITTTPTKMKLLRVLLKQHEQEPERVHFTRAEMAENVALSRESTENLLRLYRGTYLERQELKGELVEEADGALFRMEDFNEFRIEPGTEPPFRRIVVAIDPASTSEETSDETGIVVAAEGVDNHYYVLADLSLRGTPTACMEKVAAAYWAYGADYVVGEKAGVGDYMKEALAKVDSHIPLKFVSAMKGKEIRAIPASLVAAQGRLHMVGANFTELEDQLSAMTPDSDRRKARDDRADAFVWAILELAGEKAGSFKAMYGFIACLNCGEDVNQQLDRKCRCGEPVPVKEPGDRRDRSTRWAAAYMKICENGHEYSMNISSCPKCRVDPGAYLAAVAQLTGGAGQGWLAGRRL